MIESLESLPSVAGRLPQVRRAALLSAEFVLDVGKMTRGRGKVLDPLILTAILEANQAEIRRDPRLAHVYRDGANALPDALRRPISVHALAASLRMPLESVRRRVSAWTQGGMCVRTPTGVYIPQAVVTSEAYRAVQSTRVERLARFERELVHAGALAELALDGDLAPIVRSADRILGGYILRVGDQLIDLTGEAINAFLLLGLIALTLEGGPQPVAAIGAHVGMPAETVRRRLLALRSLGLAERVAANWCFAAAASRKADVRRIVVENDANLRRLFASLGDLRKAAEPG